MGYGRRSAGGGNVGIDLNAGRLRNGENVYDYRWGDAAFNGFFTNTNTSGKNFFGTAQVDYSYVADFDNGLAAQNAACRVAAVVTGKTIADFCGLGLGEREAAIAGGDSGGPQFVNGVLVGVNSYGLSFGTGNGDIVAGLNSSFGEFSGFVPTGIHTDFLTRSIWLITGASVPEPSSWAMMIVGVGATGGLLRRRRRAAIA
jgi:hypothetical protein